MCVNDLIAQRNVWRRLFSLYRAAIDTSSLARANTDAAKMRCNDKGEKTRKSQTGCDLRCKVLHDGHVLLVFIFRITLAGKLAC